MGRCRPPALLLLLAGLLLAPSVLVQAQTYALHGSGSSLPVQFIWKILDMLMSRAKPSVVLTYRGSGTGSGQSDFLGSQTDNYTRSLSDYVSADMPLPQASYDTLTKAGQGVLQLPIMLGTVSVFHNIPGLPTGPLGLNLTACTLTRILLGRTTAWNDPAVLAANPSLAANPRNASIKVVRRMPGSGSTYSLASYLSQACPSEWGSTLVTTDLGTAWAPGSVAVGTSQLMVSTLQSTPYSIGYVESYQALSVGLREVSLPNMLNVSLTSSQADLSGDLASFQSSAPAITAPWTAYGAGPLGSGTNATWPMVHPVYVYLRQNVSFLGPSSGLVMALATTLLGDEVAGVMGGFGFTPLSASMRSSLLMQLSSSLVQAPGAPAWSFEGATTSSASGQADFVFSAMRSTFTSASVAQLLVDDAATSAAVALGNPYQVHGSGSWYPSNLIRGAQHALEEQARLPVDLTYRLVNTPQAQAEFTNAAAAYVQFNHFKVGDLPLSTPDWASLRSNPTVQGALQIPITLGGLSVFYNAPAFQYGADGQPQVKLSACDLAGIYGGTLTDWSQLPALANSSAAGYRANITVFGYGVPTSHRYVLSKYMAQGCPQSWSLAPSMYLTWPATVVTTFRGNPITEPWEMAMAIASTPYSIGFLESSMASVEAKFSLFIPHLYEAALQMGDGTYATSGQANSSAAIAALYAKAPRDAAGNVDITADWSDLDAVYLPNPGAWPLSMLSYIYVYRNTVPFDRSSTLLKAVLSFLLSDESQTYGGQFGEVTLPSAWRASMATSLQAQLITPAGVQDWVYETRYALGPGAGLYSFSRDRRDWLTGEIYLNNMRLDTLKSKVEAVMPRVVRALGVPELANMTGRMLVDVAAMTETPVSLTYEVAQTPQAAIASFLQPSSPNSLLLLDAPLPRDAWTNLSSVPGQTVVQVPLMAVAVGLYYSPMYPTEFNFSACALAKLWAGSLPSWASVDVTATNPNYKSMPNKPISFGYAASEPGNLAALRAYLQAACPAVALPAMPVKATAYATGDQLAGYVQANDLGLLAVLSPLYGSSYNLSEAGVESQVMFSGTPSANRHAFLAPSDPPPNTKPNYAARDANTYFLGTMLANSAKIPQRATDDMSPLSAFVWSDTYGVGYYPITRAAWLVVRADLTGLGDTGGLVKALADYMMDGWQAKLLDMQLDGRLFGAQGLLSAYTADPANALQSKAGGPGAPLLAALRPAAVNQLLTSADVSMWPVVASSAEARGSPHAIVTSMWSPGENAAVMMALADDFAGRLNARVADLTAQLIAQNQQLNDIQNKHLAKVESIAVAGVVLSVLLSVVAMVLGIRHILKVKGIEVNMRNMTYLHNISSNISNFKFNRPPGGLGGQDLEESATFLTGYGATAQQQQQQQQGSGAGGLSA